MKLKLNCEADFVPSLYRTRIAYMIKSSLKKQQTLLEKVFEKDAFHYVFSIDFINYEIKKENLQIDNKFNYESDIIYPTANFNIYISSSDTARMNILYWALASMNVFDFSNNNEFISDEKKCYIKIKSVEKIKDPIISEKTDSTYIIQTCSPLFLDNNKKGAINFQNGNFEKFLNLVSNFEIQTKLKRTLYTPIKINCISVNPVRIIDTIKAFRDATNKPIMFFDCSVGKFSIEIDKRDLVYFLQNGLGHKNNFGFGMIEIA